MLVRGVAAAGASPVSRSSVAGAVGNDGPMAPTNAVQLQLIADITLALDAHGLSWWLFGGWGLDAQLGQISRDHGDVELWVERSDADPVRDALLSIGADVVDGEPIEESRVFVRYGLEFSSAFFDRNDDGSFGVQGRWSDWVFPPGSFAESKGEFDGASVPTMSVFGMLAMKEQYATLRNGGPLRGKDVGDIATLRALAARRGPNG